MRCPYCGGINTDQASFCASCGRDLTTKGRPPLQRQPAPQPPYQDPSYYPPPAQRQGQPVQAYPPSAQRPAAAAPTQAYPPSAQRPAAARPSQPPRVVPPEPSAPSAPAPFPPRNLKDLQALEQGALAYTVTETTTNGMRKKIVHIVYPGCMGWQQVATLFKACKDLQETRFESIVIEGYHSSDATQFSFTNGQLTLDRGVRLGSQTLDRYLIETGNGYAGDSVRIVLTE